MTRLPFRSESDVESALPLVMEHLGCGGLLAYPTETVYGMGSRAQQADLAALCALTERPPGKPFLLLVAGRDMARDFGLEFSDAATLLANRFWPGPITLVLPAVGSSVPTSLRGEGGGVAVRWSSHRNTSRLIEGLKLPLSSTSANRSGRPPLPDIAAIRAEFREAADAGELMLLDGGVSEGNLPSTLVDCTAPQAKILRVGAVPSVVVMDCLREMSS